MRTTGDIEYPKVREDGRRYFVSSSNGINTLRYGKREGISISIR